MIIKWLLMSRLADLAENELYLRGREGAAAQLTEMWERRVDGDPLAELVPGCLWAKLGKVLLGELRTPEGFNFIDHWTLIIENLYFVFNYNAKLQIIIENNEWKLFIMYHNWYCRKYFS